LRVSSSSPWIEPAPNPDDGGQAAEGSLRRAPSSSTPPADGQEPARRSECLIDVVVRLHNGDTAHVGRFVDFDEARACATSLVQGLCRGDAGDWPFVAGRFLRPGAVVSVDLIESEAPKWVGSADRAATWAGRQDDGQVLRTTDNS
jgi:hypothetical protein